MEIVRELYEGARSFLPAGVALVCIVVVIVAARYILGKRYAGLPGHRFRSQVITLVLAFAGLIIIILTLPIGDTRQGQLLSLIGILLSAAIALSSTTFVGNAMAGMMMRALRNFRPGDFIRVGKHFGRVSDRGLFHIEIQTEDRNLTTLPNLYLVTNPVKVTRSSGTIISAELSLGYDLPRTRISELLIEAARAAQLQEPFVYITSLGDFSITYRISGLLTDVKQLLSAQSHLHENVVDRLHLDGVEIVSPTFMNTRAVPEGKAFIPQMVQPAAEAEPTPKAIPEDLVFDKADEAESLEKLAERYDAIGKELEETREKLKNAGSDEERERLEDRADRLGTTRERLADVIRKRENSRLE